MRCLPAHHAGLPVPAADLGGEVGLLREGATLLSFLYPGQHPELVQALAARKATVLGAAVNGRPCPAGLGGRWRRMLLNASWVNGCVHRLMPRLKPLSL